MAAGLRRRLDHNLMEDVATAEISRTQLWQWVHRGAALDDGRKVTRELVRQIIDEEAAKLPSDAGRRFADARQIMEDVSLADDFVDFLTWSALSYID